MYELTDYIYVQKIIKFINGKYGITKRDLTKYFSININKIFIKYKKVFSKEFYFKKDNDYIFTIDGIIMLSIIINNYFIDYKTDIIISYVYKIIKIREFNLFNKIGI